MQRPLFSFISKEECINPKYRSSMEDVCAIHPQLKDNRNIFFAALMDGHGGCGTASFVASRIGENLYDGFQQRDLTTVEDILRYTFLYTDIECRLQHLMASGCTCASVTIVNNEETGKRMVYSANIGDSRVLLYEDGIVTRLSYDHKAEDDQEIRRIVASGGIVINKRVMGLLAVTRSFGDHSIKQFVISEPFIQSREIASSSSFLVLACDGVFDVLSDTEVCNIVLQSIHINDHEGAAKRIIEAALQRDTKDNVSAVVIGLFIVCKTGNVNEVSMLFIFYFLLKFSTHFSSHALDLSFFLFSSVESILFIFYLL